MYRLIRPLLFRLQPETAHRLVFRLMRGALAGSIAEALWGAPDPRLALPLAGLKLPGPVGLAAGMDKDGELTELWPKLGFGSVELGTVTAYAQPGNPRPRLFRLPEQRALINRMGFNNAGSEALASRLAELRERVGKLPAPIGVNLGKSKITPLDEAPSDYAASARRVAAVADYLVVNVSSPNTPGLRDLQQGERLQEILTAVRAEAARRPVFVKLAPDLAGEDLERAVVMAEEAGAAGIIATNTTITRPGVPEALDPGPGGLSGAPLAPRALEVISLVVDMTKLPVIGVGGIATAADVCRIFAAGAAAVQLYTALIYEGPGLVTRINRDLLAMIEERRHDSLAELRDALREEGEGALP